MGATDNWYQELSLEFADGQREVMFLDMTRSGRHKPRQSGLPAEWTKLAFKKCPCCTLTQDMYCPAALSLEETILTLNQRTSVELVTATAVDSENRRTSVKWPLQDVGAAFVQIAVFSSGCPVGSQFRPMVRDLRAFSTDRELCKHLVFKHLLRHGGDAAASEAEVVARLQPVREIFYQLFLRLQEVPRGPFQDAIPNSIVHMHSMTLYLGIKVKELIAEVMQGMR